MSQSPYKGFNRRKLESKEGAKKAAYQSPYKGFNSKKVYENSFTWLGINPPIRGSIGVRRIEILLGITGINPPIRGSIEQDTALFENYNHKR